MRMSGQVKTARWPGPAVTTVPSRRSEIRRAGLILSSPTIGGSGQPPPSHGHDGSQTVTTVPLRRCVSPENIGSCSVVTVTTFPETKVREEIGV